jgi:hypothetical protein
MKGVCSLGNFSIYLDQNVKDYRISDGRLVVANGDTTVMNRIFVRLQIQLGEWYLNLNDGLNYLGSGGILGGKYSAAQLGAIYRRAVLDDANVTAINELTISQLRTNPRSYNVYVNCTIDGGSTIELDIPVD